MAALYQVYTVMQPRAATFHTLTSGGIHDVRLQAASQAAISEWLRTMDGIYKHAPFHRRLRVLVDARHAILPPMALVTHVARLWQTQQYDTGGSRLALLHDDGALGAEAQHIAGMLLAPYIQDVCVFAPHERDAALRWLDRRWA